MAMSSGKSLPQLIDKNSTRYTSFSKRRNTIIKMAHALTETDNASVMFVSVSNPGNAYVYASPEFQRIVRSPVFQYMLSDAVSRDSTQVEPPNDVSP
ncbi:hypothetical protein RCL1_002455 [Eukaryota sp. TZLM3-RCL]